MYTIAKTFYFSASHVIGGLPPEHPCSRLHGHNYEVEVILQAAALDNVGFVRDYRELAACVDRTASVCLDLRCGVCQIIGG
jgi:6-pyruvoyltetrahydropterin/6-carboxytetrahydropterin synthase